MSEKRCRVIEEYQSSDPDPLIITKGEILTFERKESEWAGWIWCINKSGKGGWVPENYLEVQENNCEALQDYNAVELTVIIGDEFMIDKEESGWYWVHDEGTGREGWVPMKNVRIME